MSPCRVTAEVGAFHLSSQVDNGSTRMISLFITPPRAVLMLWSVPFMTPGHGNRFRYLFGFGRTFLYEDRRQFRFENWV